ncbi:type II secretion system F family protein [Jiangella muralis]|uniref:type II secretion system F family protein n=1 Tax=Jiangella muralis TaxID=702383 RepID=UPI00069EE52E|nr:type II secretion system F family protein [Jiangella muralis]
MTTTQLAVLLGLGAGAGLLVILHELVGRVGRLPHPVFTARRLTDTAGPGAVLASVAGSTAGAGTAGLRHPAGVTDMTSVTGTTGLAHAAGVDGRGLAGRVGRVVLRRAAGSSLLQVPYRDLALLRRSVAHFLGERAICAAVGLVLPTAASAALTISGARLPFVVPAMTGLVAAALLSYLPLYTVADLARAKRAEFRRAMSTYVDLVALERAAGSGATQSLESAARIGESWAFQRVRDELAHARWAGVPAWEALRTVGRELRLPELTDTGDVMRMSARDGATVYDVLRTRASAMRSELLTSDQARAGSRTERATAPLAATAVVFMLLLAAPVAMRIG